MDMEFRNGQMELSMKDIGWITRLTEKAYFITQMGMSLMENGKLIKPMDLVCINMLMVLNMRVIGRMIYSMD